MLQTEKPSSRFQGYPISFLTFYHTLQERTQIWLLKASLYQAEGAQSQGPASLLDASGDFHGSHQGPRYTCVRIYRLCAPSLLTR